MLSFMLSFILRIIAVFDDLKDLVNLFVLVLDCARIYFNTVGWLVYLLVSNQFSSQGFQQDICFFLCNLFLLDD